MILSCNLFVGTTIVYEYVKIDIIYDLLNLATELFSVFVTTLLI